MAKTKSKEPTLNELLGHLSVAVKNAYRSYFRSRRFGLQPLKGVSSLPYLIKKVVYHYDSGQHRRRSVWESAKIIEEKHIVYKPDPKNEGLFKKKCTLVIRKIITAMYDRALSHLPPHPNKIEKNSYWQCKLGPEANPFRGKHDLPQDVADHIISREEERTLLKSEIEGLRWQAAHGKEAEALINLAIGMECLAICQKVDAHFILKRNGKIDRRVLPVNENELQKVIRNRVQREYMQKWREKNSDKYCFEPELPHPDGCLEDLE